MTGYKMFFLDNPNWPTPPVTGYIPGTIMTLMGVGKVIILSLGAELLWKFLSAL